MCRAVAAGSSASDPGAPLAASVSQADVAGASMLVGDSTVAKAVDAYSSNARSLSLRPSGPPPRTPNKALRHDSNLVHVPGNASVAALPSAYASSSPFETIRIHQGDKDEDNHSFTPASVHAANPNPASFVAPDVPKFEYVPLGLRPGSRPSSRAGHQDSKVSVLRAKLWCRPVSWC